MTPGAPRTVPLTDITPNDIVIATMGPTGSGKSSFISKATGIQEAIVGHDLISKTSEISAVRYIDNESDLSLVLIDTPGLDNTFRGDSDVLNMITEWLCNMKGKGFFVTGILYFHRITDNRVRGIPTRDLIVFKDICGGFQEVLRKTTLTTTMWDEVDEAVGKRRVTELQSSAIWKTMGRYMNDQDSAKRLIQEVIRRGRERHHESLPSVPPSNRRRPNEELLSQLETLAEQQLEVLRSINTKRGLPRSPDNLQGLESEYENLRGKMEELWRQIHRKSMWGYFTGYLSRLRRFLTRT